METVTINVTLKVPTSVYELAEATARVKSQPIEQVLAEVLAAATPLVDDLPPDLQAEFGSLAELSDEALWEVARANLATGKRREYDRLLELNSAGNLSAEDRSRLEALRLESERLMLRKAHAYALLKWRGYSLPPLDKLPRPR